MRLRKNREQPEQGRDRRHVTRGGTASPAFSYYTSRTPEVSRDRLQPKQDPTQPGKSGKDSRLPPSFLAQLPFWLLVALAVVCVLKVLMLSTVP
jgi:hypothetical protein